jgi:predicted pyridoxine 5'-phosphate oxidase superfamily flavin-nucleotide-binding protein
MTVDAPLGWPHSESPLHAGEQAVQARFGLANKMEQAGRRVIRNYMPDQHREFFRQLPFIVAAAIDEHGQPWASLLTNPPGFIDSPDASHLHIKATVDDDDPLHALLTLEAPVGMLGIEPHTRRRNRLNGVITQRDDDSLSVAVRQSFGNCPKYIQARHVEYVGVRHSLAHRELLPVRSKQLNNITRSIIEQADTFFIASAYVDGSSKNVLATNQGVDVSHRGGRPGFVRIGDNTLTVPDYVGNFFFNTLGNLVMHPAAGLLFIDFENGGLLHIAVEAEVIWHGTELLEFDKAQRLLRLHIKEVLHVPKPLSLRFSAPELSPFL